MDLNNLIDLNSQALGLYQLTSVEILLRLALALIYGLFISFVFIKTDSKNENGPYIYKAVLFVPAIIATALMALGNSISSAFGLFAALSIIRFRTPIKNVREMLFLFFSIVIGICMGVGHHKVAIISMFVIIIAISIDHLFGISKRHDGFYLLRIFLNENEKKQIELDEIFSQFFQKIELIEIRSTQDNSTEVFYRVTPIKLQGLDEVIIKLKEKPYIDEVIFQSPMLS